MPAKKITTHGFLSQFFSQHELMPDRPFCWILGSGASYQSGIPTGGALAHQWLKELHEMEDFENLPLETWATEENLGIKDFKFSNAPSFYPFIYQRRYQDNKDSGYAFLEDAMDDKEPSYGYSVLAQIMAGFPHKIAITTNFDNLIAAALSIYTHDLPLVCGHESLTGYIRPNPRRPIIAKIHRDLLLNPMNSPEEINNLPPGWTEALKKILDHYTPIVLGYGGNDGSLMGFLNGISPLNGGIFWCYQLDNEPETAIHQVVERHHGRLVPIVGFDEVMLQIWEKLHLPSPIPELQAVHDKRKIAYQDQFVALNAKLKQPAQGVVAEAARKEVRQAAAAAVERLTKEKDWWAWQLKANAEANPEKAEAIYREGLLDFPESAKLAGNFANFLTDLRSKHDEAECLYLRSLELDSKSAIVTGNFAVFIKDIRKDYDWAEPIYRKAIELDPKYAHNIGNFANFLTNIRKNHDEAEQLYRRALELDPKDANITGNFAIFMTNIRKNYDEAERLYRRALELDPKHANNIANFAEFISDIKMNRQEADRLFRMAITLAPNDERISKEYSRFKRKRTNKSVIKK